MAGSYKECVIGGRRFPVDVEADVTYQYGGYVNEKKINGDGSFKNSKKRKIGMCKLTIRIDPDRDDETYLNGQAAEKGNIQFQTLDVDDNLRGGEGQLEGDMEFNATDDTVEIEYYGSYAKI